MRTSRFGFSFGSTMRRHPSRRRSENGLQVETLESRQLLAADLGVSFNQDFFDIPSIVVPGDVVQVDTAFQTGIKVINNGPQAAVGLANIAFYLSTDTSLNTSTDLLMREYRNEFVELPVFTGDPNDIGTFDPDMRVPAEITPGNYFIIVRITYPNSQIDDFNSSNNIAVSANTLRVERRFGVVAERSNITMVVKDTDDTLVAFSLSGGGTGSVTFDSQSRFVLTTTGTGTSSDLSVQTNGGDGTFDFASVTITGAIRSFSAPGARLVGAFAPSSSISTLTLGNVNGGTFTFPSTTVPVTMTLGDVLDSSITAPGGITSLTVKSWTDFNAPVDVVQTKFITTLRTLGTGNFNASLRINNNGAAGALGSAIIGGVIKGGSWVINGQAGSISAFATTAGWSATISQALTTLTTNQTLRGIVTAKTFGTINVGKDILASRILAGAYLGNDGVFGGTAGDADTFLVGRIDRLLVTRNVANSIIAAGLKSISGPGITEPQEIVGGVNARIGELRVGNVAGQTARFLANRYVGPTTIGGVAVDVRTNSRFQIVTLPPVATATNVNVSATSATISITFASFGLMDLASVSGMSVRITGPNGFSQLATLSSKGFVAGSLQARVQGVFVLNAPGGTWTGADNGEYSVQIVTGTAADSRGNFVPGGEISQFLIAV